MYHSQSIADVAKQIRIEEATDQPRKGPEELILKFSNCPPCVINAFRRVLLQKTPSLRFDDLLAGDKHKLLTCSEEIFDHRLGFIRIGTNPDLFLYEDESDIPNALSGVVGSDVKEPSFRPRYEADHVLTERVGHGNIPRLNKPPIGTHFETIPEQVDEHTCLMYELDVQCYWDEKAQELKNTKVFASALKWLPIGNQLERLTKANALPRINPNLVVAELSEGEAVHRILYAIKSTSFEYAKWRPVNCFFTPLKLSTGDPYTNSYYMKITALEVGSNPRYYLLKAVQELQSVFKQLSDDCENGVLKKST